MASLNGIYVFVEDESMQRAADVSSHAVEDGTELTDHVKMQARTLEISGEIVGSDSAQNQQIFKEWMKNGTLVSYAGRNIFKNALIISFDTEHPNTIWGGCSFSMQLQEIRIAQSSYTPQTEEETIEKTETAETQQCSTQQIEQNNTDYGVYHTVKSGDTVYNLVAASDAPYKQYGKDCQWIMDNNADAFAVKDDFGSLIVGAKLLVGYRSEQAEQAANTEVSV